MLGVVPNVLFFPSEEYIDFNAKPIPFRKIGYASLEDFLIDSGDFCKISRNSSGKLLVKVVESEDTAHIRRLVAKQVGVILVNSP